MTEPRHEQVPVPMVSNDQPGYPWPQEIVEFVRHAYRRRPVEWPQLYDELCYLACRGSFRGLGFEELAQLGLHFTLDELPKVARLAERVADEEQEARHALRESIRGGGEADPEAPSVAEPQRAAETARGGADRRRPMTLPVARSLREPVPMARVTVRGVWEPSVVAARGGAG